MALPFPRKPGLPSFLLRLLLLQVAAAHLTTTTTTAEPLPALAPHQQPTAIRKMGFDAGEKFFPEYYTFGDSDAADDADVSQQQVLLLAAAAPPLLARARRGLAGVLTQEEEALLAAVNSSASIPYRAPLAAHFYDYHDGSSSGSSSSGNLEARDRLAPLPLLPLLAKRDYACPTGTSSCSSIGYPDSCCQAGTTCVQIDDTGLGSVGCCPDGESCTGEIACSDGQQGCSSESGGGCCIPGYECASVGCELDGFLFFSHPPTSPQPKVCNAVFPTYLF